MQKENIYEYIMAPLENAYRTRDFLAGITECCELPRLKPVLRPAIRRGFQGLAPKL